MNRLLATVVSIFIALLLFVCQEVSGSTGSTVEAEPKQLANPYNPYESYSPYSPYSQYSPYGRPFIVPTKPGSSFGKWTAGNWPYCTWLYSTPQKPFGGDRSDKFLYPDRGYYVRWAMDERKKDYTRWYQYGLSRGWLRPSPPRY